MSQFSHTQSAKIGRSEVLKQAQNTVADFLRAHPRMNALEATELLIREADTDLTAKLNEALTREFYLHTVRALRRQFSERAQFQLPGFEHLPLSIPGPRGKLIPLLKSSYTGIRRYYRSLLVGHRKRTKNDPRVIEAKRLMEKMRTRSRRRKRITVEQLVLIER